MGKQLNRRRFRLWLAPPGTRREAWIRGANQFLSRVQKSSPGKVLSKLLPGRTRQAARRYRRKWIQRKLAPLQDQLNQIMAEHAHRELIIFPPSLNWNTQLFQRPQHLALALSRQGALIFYIQPPGADNPLPLQRIQEGLFLCRWPIEAFDALKSPYVYLLTWNRDYARIFNNPRILYDFVDEIETFAGDHSQMRRDHQKLIFEAQLVLTTAVRLYEQVSPFRPDALLCPNGVAYDHFAKMGDFRSEPEDLLPVVQRAKPVIGYYGAMAQWFDFDLWLNLAKARQDLSFVLIGPDYDGSLPPSLLDLPNVFWLGVKPYSLLPEYLKDFDVAVIPFKLNKITHATSPLKLFEYMAAGKPVVITPMHESMRYEGVLVAETAQDFSEQIDRALVLREDPQYLAVLERVARQNTWDVRARQILDALRQKEA
jgi:glycosyltransferase involved in cell wall biosynthesis